jgi:hypothetical protein
MLLFDSVAWVDRGRRMEIMRMAAAGACGQRQVSGPRRRWAVELAEGSLAHIKATLPCTKQTGKAPK